MPPKPPAPRDFKVFPKLDYALISSSPIITAVQSLPLGENVLCVNRYTRNTVSVLEAELLNGAVSSTAALVEYAASSVVGHWLDSASYLGRALQAQQRGDYAAAAHLGYYAQLRSAMSILATRGIVVLSRYHAKLDSASGTFVNVYKMYCGTHNFVWYALQDLADSPTLAMAPVVTSAIRSNGVTLSALLSIMLPGKTSLSFLPAILNDWGMDIARYANDRAVRNEASYRPELARQLERQPFVSAQFTKDIWLELQPTTGSPFGSIDKFLLRRAIEIEWVGARGELYRTGSAYRTALESAVKQLLNSPAKEAWLEFLLRKDRSDSTLLRYAALSARVPARFVHAGVLARGILLFRIASAFAIDAGGTNVSQSQPSEHILAYVRNAGVSGPPHEAVDLWDDVQTALDALAQRPSSARSSLLKDLARELSDLALFEVVPLWATAV